MISVYTTLSTYRLYPLVILSFYLHAKAQSSKRRLPSPTHPPPLHRPEGRAWLRCHHLGLTERWWTAGHITAACCQVQKIHVQTTIDTFDMTCMGMGNMIIWCSAWWSIPQFDERPWHLQFLEVPQLCIVHSRFLPLCLLDRKGFQFDKTKHIENNECVANHGHSEQNHGQSKNEVHNFTSKIYWKP